MSFDEGFWQPLPSGGSGGGGRVLGYAQVTANSSGFTAETDISGLSVAVTVPPGHRIRISARTHPSSTANNDAVQINLKEGTSLLQLDRVQLGISTTGLRSLPSDVVLSPTAGAHTYKVSMARDSGSGTITNNANPSYPSFILVEDLDA